MPSEKSTIIDAVARFRAKQEFGELDTGIDEMRLMQQVASEQPEAFKQFLAIAHPRIAGKLGPELNNDMPVQLVDIETDEESPDNANAVYYFYEKGVLKPRLYVGKKDVKQLYHILEPLFYTIEMDSEEEKRRLRLESAVTVVAWMGLGKWAFDKLDPRGGDELRRFGSNYELLMNIAGLTIEDYQTMESDEIDEEIDRAMIELKYQLLGALAYRNLMDRAVLHGVNLDLIMTDLRIFQKFYQQLIEHKADVLPEEISTLQFALAYPLPMKDAGKVLDRFSQCL